MKSLRVFLRLFIRENVIFLEDFYIENEASMFFRITFYVASKRLEIKYFLRG